MDININAKNHLHQTQLNDYYLNHLSQKFERYKFIKTLEIKIVKNQSDQYVISLTASPTNGQVLFAEADEALESIALKSAIKKLSTQLEKYKEVHYKSSHKNKSVFQ